MHIRRFEAPTLQEALGRVKQELGPDALVLSHRSVRRDGGWFGWFGRPVVEVVAALDREPLRETESAPPRVAPDPSWRSLSLTKALVDPLEAEVRSLRRSLEALGAESSQRGLARELAELRRTVADLATQVRAGSADPPDELTLRLESAGFSRRHARSLVEEATRRAAEAEREGSVLPAETARRLALHEILAARLDGRMPPPRDRAGPRVSMLVGATGVGKTTTLAKLAARQEVHADAVALVTTDTYRVGADAQLRVFADRLGARFEVATSAEDLARRVERLGRRRVFVDTAGRSPSDPHALPELHHCRERLGDDARVQLVLSANAGDATLRAELERFRGLGPQSLIVTKVDESENLAPVANLLLDEASPPLAWLATGQRVPEDLEVPDPEGLVVRMLGVAG